MRCSNRHAGNAKQNKFRTYDEHKGDRAQHAPYGTVHPHGGDAGKYGYKLIKKECGNIKLIDKFKTQHKTFSFYFVEKNSPSY